jgi:hypothetical protein
MSIAEWRRGGLGSVQRRIEQMNQICKKKNCKMVAEVAMVAEAGARQRVRRRQAHSKIVRTTAKVLHGNGDGASTTDEDCNGGPQRVQRRRACRNPEGGEGVRTTTKEGKTSRNLSRE